MSYDFSNHNTSTKKAKKAKKSKKPSTNHRTPGWVWMLIGLLLGGAIVLFYPEEGANQNSLTNEELAIESPEKIDVQSNDAIESNDDDSTDNALATDSEKSIVQTAEETSTVSTTFDFYTILSEQEVMVQELQRPTLKNKHTAQKQTTTKKRNLNPNKDYLLQAGSFQKEKDALRLVDTIKKLGLNVNIEKNNIKRNSQSSIWHRVMVGPLTNSDEIYRTEKLLIGNGIKTLLIQRR